MTNRLHDQNGPPLDVYACWPGPTQHIIRARAHTHTRIHLHSIETPGGAVRAPCGCEGRWRVRLCVKEEPALDKPHCGSFDPVTPLFFMYPHLAQLGGFEFGIRQMCHRVPSAQTSANCLTPCGSDDIAARVPRVINHRVID